MQPPSSTPPLGLPGEPPQHLDGRWGPGPLGARAGSRWLLLALLGFLAGQVLALAAVSLLAVTTGNGSKLQIYAEMARPPEWYVLGSLLGLWVGFIAAALGAARGRGLMEAFGLSLRWGDLAYIAVGVGAQFAVALAYLPFQDRLTDLQAPTERLVGSSQGLGIVAIVLATGLLAPAMEELFFRGLVLRALLAIAGRGRGVVGALGAVACVALDGAIFAAAHAQGLQFAGLMALGCLLAVLTMRAERLGPAIVVHASFNLTALAFAFGGS